MPTTFTAHKHGRDIHYMTHDITPTRYRSASPLSIKAHRITNGVIDMSFENVYPHEVLVHSICPMDDEQYKAHAETVLNFTRRAYNSAVKMQDDNKYITNS